MAIAGATGSEQTGRAQACRAQSDVAREAGEAQVHRQPVGDWQRACKWIDSLDARRAGGATWVPIAESQDQTAGGQTNGKAEEEGDDEVA